jgi:gliding motility-associated-like protein
LFSFTNPTRCDGNNTLGILRATADGSTSIIDYTFEWYAGGTPVVGPPFEPNNYEIVNQVAGDYTVVATNNTTGCSSEQTYTLETIITVLQVAVSSSPLTSCITDDGSVFAAISNSTGTYDFTWYNGQDVTAAPDYTTQAVNNLSEGDYTVVAVDQADAFCITRANTVFVEDAKIYPEITVLQTSPLTNCDPSKPNAQISASVNGQVAGYIFEWRAGVDSTSTNILYTGPIIEKLAAGDYTVVATNNISGCSSVAIYNVPNETLPITSPTALVLSNVTNCTDPNGKIDAHVDGITSEYIFEWHIGSTIGATPDYTTHLVSDLAIGFYTVRAIHKVTGCISNPATVEVTEEILYPEFETVTGPSICAEPIGYAEIVFLDGYFYDKVEWVIDNDTIPGLGIYDVPAGEYPIIVTGFGGCVTEEIVVVGTEIKVYNGISPNGDGSNDVWMIDCIQNFENNNVKLYNRSGQLVYETDNYNNDDISFDGVGNKGIYIGKSDVPDGTYFFIIDKGDGSDQSSGYIELIR